jgi:hypothetical protein
VAAVIHRGVTFTFDDAFCRCDTRDTAGQFAKCPVCHPERYTDPARLLAWLDATLDARDLWWHVYGVASSWLNPGPSEALPDPHGRRILLDLASGDPDRIARWCIPADPAAAPRLTAEASRVFLDHG